MNLSKGRCTVKWAEKVSKYYKGTLVLKISLINAINGYIYYVSLVETKEEEHKELIEKKDLEILELMKQLKAQEKEKQNEIIKLQIEVRTRNPAIVK